MPQNPVAQARPRQPADRAARRLRRSRPLHHRRDQEGLCRRHREQRPELVGRDHRASDSQSNPNRAAEVASELILEDEVDIITGGLDAGHHQPGRRPGRSQRSALHHHRLPVAALFLRAQRRSGRRASTGPTTSSGASRTSSPPSSRFGSRAASRRASAGSSPTMPTAMPGATPSSASRRRCRRRASR